LRVCPCVSLWVTAEGEKDTAKHSLRLVVEMRLLTMRTMRTHAAYFRASEVVAV
jgi:hypothetical protein